MQLLPLIEELREEIRLLKNGKKSKTSHTPPSHDIGRSNQKNSREKSGKNSGGQKGHKGSTLQMQKVPDEVVNHEPSYCTCCGKNLEETPSVLENQRQEIIIPPISVKYIEHRVYSKTCTCGHQTKADFPKNITAPVQYGDNIAGLITYLSIYQYLPYNRIKKLLKDLYKISISEGTIYNILCKAAKNAEPVYQEILSRITQSNVVGADETGTKINTKKGWFHVWQNPYITFIASSLNRGYATVEKYFDNGFPNAVYVSDCWSAQLKVKAKLHQLCLAHLLRELSNFEDSLQCNWSKELKNLFKEAISLKNQMTISDFSHPPDSVIEIKKKLEDFLNVDTEKWHKKAKAFVNRLIKNKDYIFTFLDYQEVPYDNNASERAIRNIKVKNKISGCFRSEIGAENFAIIRSVIDTTIKNTQNVFGAIQLVLNTRPE